MICINYTYFRKIFLKELGIIAVVPLAGTWIEIEQMDMDAVNEKRRSLCGNVKLSTCILENGKICLRNFERCTTIK